MSFRSLLRRTPMFRFARRLAILLAITVAFSSAPLPAQSPPGSPAQSTPSNPALLPSQPAPPSPANPQSPTSADPAAQPATAPAAAMPQQPATSSNHAKAPKAAKKDNDKPIDQADIHNASLWRDPGNISAKNMFYGDGGKDGEPVPPFKFISEDTSGTNPKFDVKDATGTKWRVKLGEEARPEVVASRLLWAVGYYVNDDYLLHIATIQGLD